MTVLQGAASPNKKLTDAGAAGGDRGAEGKNKSVRGEGVKEL